MASERTLLERLDNPDPPGGQHLRLDVNRLKRSVLTHVQRMLNCRQGLAPAQPDYGIPDLNEFMFAYPDSIGPMRQAIEQSIEKYEPRLSHVKAEWIADEENPLNIRFEITARLVAEDSNIPVSFTTNLGAASTLNLSES
ncbi:MAG: type VI secretion system baseplate subunit TssE [candidate division Zixibacteria bacterium]|nr:type VI secretion system baseplate subunit TssE [candidate division Zixibacteria bacterium]